MNDRQFNFMKVLSFFILTLGISAYSIADTQLRFAQDVTIKYSQGDAVSVNQATPFVLQAHQSALVEAKGRVPLLVVMPQYADEVKVDLPKIEDWPSDQTKEVIEKGISEVVSIIFLAQKHIQQKNYQEALRLIELNKVKFPYIKELDVMKISTLILLKRKEEAYAHLAKSLEIHSADENLLELEKILKQMTRRAEVTR